MHMDSQAMFDLFMNGSGIIAVGSVVVLVILLIIGKIKKKK